jgi:serine/threonine-protein kinase
VFDLERRDELSAGHVLAGRYRLDKPIGRGGMGLVYQATQLDLARPVAIKVLRPGVAEQRGACDRFRREAKVAAALHHHGAVSIHDFGEDQGHLFIVMELLEGVTLRQELSREVPLEPLARALEIARDIAAVLVEAHGIGLIHRDLKPGNIFLDSSLEDVQRVVVADFGLAFIQDGEGVGRMTREGVVTGTPAYLSPEQAMGRQVGPESDIYSLACTLYEMVVGRIPFEAEGELAVLNQHLFASPAKPSAARVGDALTSQGETIPSALDELLLHMLAKHPPERPDALAVKRALDDLLDRLGQPERSRGPRLMAPRIERMLGDSGADHATPTLARRVEPLPTVQPTKEILVVAEELDAELRLGLLANGWNPRLGDGDSQRPTALALFAPGASLLRLLELKALGLPLVTDTDASDLDRISALIEAGIDEVLPRPATPDELCRRLDRMIRRSHRIRRAR